MPVVGTGLRHDIDHRSACASQFRAVSVGTDAKFLYHFVGELIRCAIPSPGLREETIVIVGAVEQIAGLIAANPSEGEIAIRTGSQAARVRGDARRQQRKIGITSPWQRQIPNRAFVDQGGNCARLRLHQGRCVGYGQRFLGAGHCQLKR